jgi:hypothetical protein
MLPRPYSIGCTTGKASKICPTDTDNSMIPAGISRVNATAENLRNSAKMGDFEPNLIAFRIQTVMIMVSFGAIDWSKAFGRQVSFYGV